jgi:hypothetical protein
LDTDSGDPGKREDRKTEQRGREDWFQDLHVGS